MNKREAKKFCKDVIDDIVSIQTTPARNFIDQNSFIHLCHFKNILQGYLDEDTFPKDIDFPEYDLSPLADHPFVSIDFKVLHKEKAEGRIDMSQEVYQLLHGGQ